MQPPHFESKFPGEGTTIFTVMSSLAAKFNAINLGQGFPDYPMDPALAEAVNKAMQAGFNQYAHTNGLPGLREKISAKVGRLYNAGINPETEITVTPGGTYALFTAFASLLHPGDEVIVIEPAYDSYVPQITLFGAKPVLVQMDSKTFSIPWDDIGKKINVHTKAIVINSPNNPTGSVLDGNDISALRHIIDRHRIYIISDEVYEHLIFDGREHLSMLRYPDLLARSFVCFSFGKTYNCTGWKLGYCIAPAPLTAGFRSVHQFNAFSCHTPVQHGFAAFMDREGAYRDLGKVMQAKRDFLRNCLAGSAFLPLPGHGSYFQLYSYKNISALPEKEFTKKLVEKAGVAAIPLSAFYRSGEDHQTVRLCFAKKETTLAAAAERLRRVSEL